MVDNSLVVSISPRSTENIGHIDCELGIPVKIRSELVEEFGEEIDCSRGIVVGCVSGAESLVDASLEIVVRRYGKEWDGRGGQKRLGKRPLEAAASVIEDYDLPCTPFDFNNEVLALLQERFVLGHNFFLPLLSSQERLLQSPIDVNISLCCKDLLFVGECYRLRVFL